MRACKRGRCWLLILLGLVHLGAPGVAGALELHPVGVLRNAKNWVRHGRVGRIEAAVHYGFELLRDANPSRALRVADWASKETHRNRKHKRSSKIQGWLMTLGVKATQSLETCAEFLGQVENPSPKDYRRMAKLGASFKEWLPTNPDGIYLRLRARTHDSTTKIEQKAQQLLESGEIAAPAVLLDRYADKLDSHKASAWAKQLMSNLTKDMKRRIEIVLNSDPDVKAQNEAAQAALDEADLMVHDIKGAVFRLMRRKVLDLGSESGPYHRYDEMLSQLYDIAHNITGPRLKNPVRALQHLVAERPDVLD